MELPKKVKILYQLFIAFLKTTSKKGQVHS